MTGWRVGYAAGPAWLIDRMLIVHQHLISEPASFAQKGAVVAYSHAAADVRNMVSAYKARRDALYPQLQELPGITATIPEGACFYFLRIDSDLPSLELTNHLARTAALLLTPGSAFGPGGDGHLRLSFAALPEALIPEVMNRLREGLSTLP